MVVSLAAHAWAFSLCRELLVSMNLPTHASEQKSKLVSRSNPVAVHVVQSLPALRFRWIISLAGTNPSRCPKVVRVGRVSRSTPHWSHFTRLIFMILTASGQIATHRHATPFFIQESIGIVTYRWKWSNAARICLHSEQPCRPGANGIHVLCRLKFGSATIWKFTHEQRPCPSRAVKSTRFHISGLD